MLFSAWSGWLQYIYHFIKQSCTREAQEKFYLLSSEDLDDKISITLIYFSYIFWTQHEKQNSINSLLNIYRNTVLLFVLIIALLATAGNSLNELILSCKGDSTRQISLERNRFSPSTGTKDSKNNNELYNERCGSFCNIHLYLNVDTNQHLLTDISFWMTKPSCNRWRQKSSVYPVWRVQYH